MVLKPANCPVSTQPIEVDPHCNGQLQCTLSNYGDDGLSEHVPSALTLAMDVINRSINRSILGRSYSKYLQMLGQWASYDQNPPKSILNISKYDIYIYIYTICIHNYYVTIYMSRDPHTPPHPARWFPPRVAGEGGFSQQPSHGVCSLYSAYNAYVSIIRMDILYVI